MTKNTNLTRHGRSDAGFTLIELMVVIAVIGIIASISLIAMVTYREKAQAARVAQEVANFQKAAAVYYAENQRYPDPSRSSNASLACYLDGATNADGALQKCCVSQGGCEYAGDVYVTLEDDGDFASAPRAPHWLTYLGETAHAIFGGSMPSFLTEAPAVTGYKGVFYECANDACTNAYVYFTVPPTLDSCTRGAIHGDGEFFGVCAQDITGGNVDGSSSGGTENCGNGTCAVGENCAGDCSTETHCSDGVDNDGDGGSDEADSDCGETAEDCGNGIDDGDADSDVDCADSECSEDPACATPSEECSTLDDEDGDGQGQCGDTDDCDGWSGNESWSSETSYTYDYCSGGLLQNGSGSGSCSNASDDDSDGQTDCADIDCSSDPACGVATEDCFTYGDEDGDGCYDGVDSDCGGGEVSCGDGLDDNCNGSIDEGC